MKLLQAVFTESSPLQANFVQPVRMRFPFRAGNGKRQHVLCDHRAAADVSMPPDPHKLMHRRQRADDGPLLDRHVSRERGSIDQHGVVPYEAVVPDMGISHDQNVTAHTRYATTLYRPAING